jgi:PII-like signaling protein
MDGRSTVNDDCLKVTSYFGERVRVEGRFFSDLLLDTFEEYDISTSILLRATAGFGLRHHLRTDQTLSMSEDPSVMAVAADTRARIAPLLPRLVGMQPRGMLTVERARVVRDDITSAPIPEELHEATKLTIYVGRHQRAYRVPAHVAICDLLHRRGVAGATVLMGVDGTSHGQRERAHFWDNNKDVPTMIIAVGEGARIQRVLPELGALLEHPMLTVERVRVCKRDGDLLARPHAIPNRSSEGLGLWQKLMIYTSESHLHDGEPIHRGIIRRLRETSARGATSLRGIWGFHGDHAPHGDRLLQIGRRVPVVTVLVDTPENIAQSFSVIDELTSEHGLVTSEMIPAMQYFGTDTAHGGIRLASHDY